MLASAFSGCATMPAAPTASVQQETVESDLDSYIYTRSADKAMTANAHVVAAEAVIPQVAPNPANAFAGEPPYRLDSGDRLRIMVFGQEGLTNSYSVDANGAITMPLIKSIKARGLTTEELARVVTDRLRGGYIREPHVAIEIEIHRPFFILGEVTVP